MYFTQSQQDVIAICFYVTNSIGLVGSFFNIVTYLYFKETRNESTQFIFFLAIADFIAACANNYIWTLGTHDDDDRVCSVQGFFVMFGLSAAMMWALAIGTFSFLFKILNFYPKSTKSTTRSTLKSSITKIIFYIFLLGVYIFLVLYKNYDLEVVKKLMFLFHVVTWGYALFASVLSLSENQYLNLLFYTFLLISLKILPNVSWK